MRFHSSAGSRSLETFGLLAVLGVLAVFLARCYEIIAFSDPVRWFSFARNFTASFAHTPLAYGFPLYQAAAIAMVGPFYGFLANIPVLVALAGLVYGFARQHGKRPMVAAVEATDEPPPAPVIAAASLSFLLAINREVLVHLANPYRDALSHLLAVAACVLLVMFRHGERRSLTTVAASGACLALATSARETAALLLLPFLVYAIASKREDGTLPFWKPLLVFGAAFCGALLPLLIQNYLYSGNPAMPAQMNRWMVERNEFVPGIRFAHLAATLPELLGTLVSHYGVAGPLLLVGVWVSVRRRIAEALYLTLPAFLTFVVFYGAYVRVVTRYVFVIDLFAAPIAGIGVAAIAAAGLRSIHSEHAHRIAASSTLLLAFLPAATLAFPGDRPRFQLAQARRLRSDLIHTLPRNATVAGERPYAEIIECFAGDLFDVHYQARTLRELRALLSGKDAIYFIDGGSVRRIPPPLRVATVAQLEGLRHSANKFRVLRIDDPRRAP